MTVDTRSRTRRASIVAIVLSLANLTACEAGGGAVAGASGGDLVFQHSDVHILGTSDEIASVEDLEVLPDGTVANPTCP